MNKYPKECLNEIKWRYNGLEKTEIYYINRGSPNDIGMLEGKNIKNIGGFSLVLYNIPIDKHIPYHRIVKIIYDGRVLFSRDRTDMV